MVVNANSYPIPDPSVVGKTVENREAILILPGKGQIKVLNEVAARIWELADGSRTVAQIAQGISNEFQVSEQQAEQDTWDFLNTLAEKELLHFEDAPKKTF